MTMEPEIGIDRFEIFANGLDHPECCAFDRDGNLWAGGEAGQLYRVAPSGKVEEIANLGGFCCGIALSPDDRELFGGGQSLVPVVVPTDDNSPAPTAVPTDVPTAVPTSAPTSTWQFNAPPPQPTATP